MLCAELIPVVRKKMKTQEGQVGSLGGGQGTWEKSLHVHSHPPDTQVYG